jgi:integrase
MRLGFYAKVGSAGGLTVAAARAIALEWAELYKSGVQDLRKHFADLEVAKAATAETAKREATVHALEADLERQRRVTIRQVFERWAATDLAPQVGGDGKRIGRKDGGQYVREQFERRVFPLLGSTAIVDVRKADVLAILDTVKGEGKLRTANVLLADLKQMFRFAAEREIIGHSPIELLRKKKIGGKDVKRNRFLAVAELVSLVNQLPSANLDKRTELGVWLILSTGCRVGELMGAAWSDCKRNQGALQQIVDAHNVAQKSGAVHLGFVDEGACTWHLPTTKNQRAHAIHLSQFALSLFVELRKLREADPVTGGPQSWVFPNARGTGPVNVKSFGKQLADRQRQESHRLKNRTKAVDALKLEGGRWTAHDLRRTASTLMSQLGISDDVINECLNHIKQGMSSIYMNRTGFRGGQLS